jgi:hypothetical protein
MIHRLGMQCLQIIVLRHYLLALAAAAAAAAAPARLILHLKLVHQHYIVCTVDSLYGTK